MDASNSEDYYRLLGVDGRTDGAALRGRFRELAHIWHPDRAGPEAAATFQQLATAYAVLSDPEARAAYDRARFGAGDLPAPRVRPAPGVRLSRLSGPLAALLARGVARYSDDDMIELLLDAQEAAAGGMVDIAMRVAVHCPACGGRSCARCGARGTVEDVFSAWLAVRPGVADGAVLTPSAWLPGMVQRVYFRARLR